MKAVIQRVSKANVVCSSGHSDKINKGLLIFLGVGDSDTEEDISWLTRKIINLRIFDDENGKMNLSLSDINGECMIISQFTLHASTKKGNRPSYIKAAGPDEANSLYEQFAERVEKELGKQCAKGIFGDHMDISLVNDGPVTIIIDSKNKE